MKKYGKLPPHISHIGGRMIGLIGALTAVIVVGSAAATFFPDVFRLDDVHLETEATQDAVIDNATDAATAPETEKNIDSLIKEAASEAVSDAAESAGLDETDLEKLNESESAGGTEESRATAAPSSAAEKTTAEAEGPAAETTKRAESVEKPTAETEAPEGPGNETTEAAKAGSAEVTPVGPGAETN